jgi:hypothetical protein
VGVMVMVMMVRVMMVMMMIQYKLRQEISSACHRGVPRRGQSHSQIRRREEKELEDRRSTGSWLVIRCF